MHKSKKYDDLLNIIEQDRDELVELCLRLGNVMSPHGKERAVGEIVLEWFAKNGIQSFRQSITSESINAIGVLPGTGGGNSLILNAHMDTGSELRADTSDDEKKIEGAWVDGELIFGRGVINDKAQLCAFLVAARAIRKAQIRLKGDLTVTGVAFETGFPSVDERQGINFPGEGFGTKWLVDRGVTADYALVGETSGFGIIRAECGAVWLKIRVKGRGVYTPRLERGSSLQENPNVFAKAGHVIVALEDWAAEYQVRETVEFAGGVIVPKAQIIDIRREGGGEAPTPPPSPFCAIYVDIRLAPGKNPRLVHKEIEALIEGLGVDADVSMFQYSRGYIAKNAEPLTSALVEAHRYVFGTEPPLPPSHEVSMWRDVNAFNEVGIPSVCYGPARQKESMSGAQNRAMKISDLVAATKVYALAALRVCGEDEDQDDDGKSSSVQ